MTPSLKKRFSEQGLISAPGVYDMISLKIADRMGFELLYMTGYGAVASALGLPDAGLASYQHNGAITLFGLLPAPHQQLDLLITSDEWRESS